MMWYAADCGNQPAKYAAVLALGVVPLSYLLLWWRPREVLALAAAVLAAQVWSDATYATYKFFLPGDMEADDTDGTLSTDPAKEKTYPRMLAETKSHLVGGVGGLYMIALETLLIYYVAASAGIHSRDDLTQLMMFELKAVQPVLVVIFFLFTGDMFLVGKSAAQAWFRSRVVAWMLQE
ncbi:hypothetical protein WJX73_002209 [Symbiochloris irregularis]|uniref:Uncharacterized protein n=1 Tax=Symbiochloris irregularis TaxID=706552 RepID=A0AAW1NM69_9CHLO